MATAGITDGSLGALNPQEELRLGGTPGIPRASAAGEHRSSREPNGPQAASNPTARGRPSYSRSRESPPNPHPTLTAPASPNSTPTPLLAPTRSAGGLPKKGVGRRNPRLEGRFGDSDCSPQLERRGTQENSQMTTHLSCGPVFGSGSSDVPIAATWSLRLPRPIPQASAEQRLLTAHARAAAGGRGDGGGWRTPRAPSRRGSTAAEGRRSAPARHGCRPPRAALPLRASCSADPAPGLTWEEFPVIHPKTSLPRSACPLQ